MKKLFIFCISVLPLFTSCEKETTIPPEVPTPADLVAMARDEIADNRALLDKTYEELARRLPADTIKHLRKTSRSRVQFVLKMLERSEGLFADVVKANQDNAAADYYLKIGSLEGDSDEDESEGDESDAEALSELYINKKPVEEYATLIAKNAKAASEKRNKWILVKAYAYPDGTTLPIPEAETVMQHQHITAAIQMAGIVLNSTMSDQDQENATGDLASQANIPSMMNGLLLPAVQHYTDQPSADPFMNWLNNDVNPAINGGLNRDLIRRVAAAGFLGSLECLINESFINNNHSLASFQVLEAKFKTTLIFLSNEIF